VGACVGDVVGAGVGCIVVGAKLEGVSVERTEGLIVGRPVEVGADVGKVVKVGATLQSRTKTL
jgi:hypothetical protein